MWAGFGIAGVAGVDPVRRSCSRGRREARADDMGNDLAGHSISSRSYLRESMRRPPGVSGGEGEPAGIKTATPLGADSRLAESKAVMK